MNDFVSKHSRLVWKWVRHYSFLCDNRADVDKDDLYQAGCMGLIDALGGYDSTKGAWTTWASIHIRKWIRETLGRGKRLQTVPLDAPAYRDIDDVTLSETLPDESIIPDDDRLQACEIVRTVRAAVDALPEDVAPTVRAVGLQELSRAAAAQKMGISDAEVRKRYRRGLNGLRSNKDIRALHELDLETPFHARKGVKAFFSSGSSIVEDIVTWRLKEEGY